MTTPAQYEAAIRFLEKLAGQWRSDANRVEWGCFPNYAAIHREAAAEVESALAIVREAESNRAALVKVLAHTGLPPNPSPDLLRGLLARVARIATAALNLTPEVPDAR